MAQRRTRLFPELHGDAIQPGQALATLHLDNFGYAGCVFAVQFVIADTKLVSLQLESEGIENFRMCHAQILAALKSQYGEEPGGVSPVSPYEGYSLHAEWRGPKTDVIYNELQNVSIEARFSPTYGVN
jgi:hypothetical protein